jgi:precorrin-2 methylase
MKIGSRLADVLDLLARIDVIENCVFASRLGLTGEVRSGNLADLEADDSFGYLSTILIRRNGKGQRKLTDSVSRSLAGLEVDEVVSGIP